MSTATSLVRLSLLVQHAFADVGRDHDLTPQQLQLLCVLIERPLGMSELSRLLHQERSSMTGLVDRVEKRRLVSRAADPSDGRACRVTLTDDGHALAVQAHNEVIARLDTMTDLLTPSARHHLDAALTDLLAEQASR